MTDIEKTVDLFPEEPFVTAGRKGQTAAKYLRIADLTGYKEDTVRPTKAFIASIRKAGVLESIVVTEEDGKLVVKDGKRRVLAAIECGIKTIQAEVIATANLTQAEVLTIITNFHRRPNPVAELKAIESIMGEVGSAETVAKELGIPLNVLRRRLKILRLVPEARMLFDADIIPLSVAEEMSALPTEAQNALVAKAAMMSAHPTESAKTSKKPRIRMKDVREARYAEQKATAATLPDNLFKDQAETSPSEIDLMAHVVTGLDTRAQRVRTLLLMDGGFENPTLAAVGADAWEATTTLARKIVAVIDSVVVTKESKTQPVPIHPVTP